jgi:hypothetical protein
MDHSENYRAWKEERANMEPPPDFSRRILEQVYLLEKRRSEGALKKLLSQLDFLPSPLLRAAFAFGALILGIFRIYFISANILIP